ncbi:hypothetical protein BDD12DRAFT_182694 [Trichophaea hybrida]|nr:hypothetical protein BDD12DRAFT_182694 [Trichophaea hybrida]
MHDHSRILYLCMHLLNSRAIALGEISQLIDFKRSNLSGWGGNESSGLKVLPNKDPRDPMVVFMLRIGYSGSLPGFNVVVIAESRWTWGYVSVYHEYSVPGSVGQIHSRCPGHRVSPSPALTFRRRVRNCGLHHTPTEEGAEEADSV